MKEYFYIYRDSFKKWNIATNPQFIAEHKDCRAIKKWNGIYFINQRDYIAKLNKEI